MPSCAVFGCANCNRKTKGSNIKYFKFPKDWTMTKKWIIACRRKDNINLKNAVICSVHFDKDAFEIPLIQRLLNYVPKNSRNLKLEATPTLSLPDNSNHEPGNSKENRKSDQERENKIVKRGKKAVVLNNLSTTEKSQVEVFDVLKIESTSLDTGCQKNVVEDFGDLLESENSRNKILRLEKEIEDLKAKNGKLHAENKTLRAVCGNNKSPRKCKLSCPSKNAAS